MQVGPFLIKLHIRRTDRRWEVQISEPTPATRAPGFAIVGPITYSRPLTSQRRAVQEARRVAGLDVNFGYGIRAINVETGEEVCIRSLAEAWAQHPID